VRKAGICRGGKRIQVSRNLRNNEEFVKKPRGGGKSLRRGGQKKGRGKTEERKRRKGKQVSAVRLNLVQGKMGRRKPLRGR